MMRYCVYLGEILFYGVLTLVLKLSTIRLHPLLVSRWITFLLCDLGVPLQRTPTLLCDNLNVLYLTKNPTFHYQAIELNFHFVWEKVNQGYLITTHVPSVKQIADLFYQTIY